MRELRRRRNICREAHPVRHRHSEPVAALRQPVEVVGEEARPPVPNGNRLKQAVAIGQAAVVGDLTSSAQVEIDSRVLPGSWASSRFTSVSALGLSCFSATAATMPPQIYSKVWLTFASRRCSGVTDSSAVASRWAILPSSVCMPVATTSANPVPVVTDVPMNTKSWRSASGVPAAVGETSFATGALSPVKGASFVVNACAV